MTTRLIVTGRPLRSGRAGWAGPHRQRGITYLITLFLVALVGMGLAALGTVWETEAKRERERDLLFIGQQFSTALWRYYEASPGIKEYPRRLEDLLEDRRQQTVQRHLRQIFVDPVTAERDWGVEVVAGRIVAVHSRSTAEPLLRAGFPSGLEDLAGAKTYSAWIFRSQKPVAGPGRIESLAIAVVSAPDPSSAQTRMGSTDKGADSR